MRLGHFESTFITFISNLIHRLERVKILNPSKYGIFSHYQKGDVDFNTFFTLSMSKR